MHHIRITAATAPGELHVFRGSENPYFSRPRSATQFATTLHGNIELEAVFRLLRSFPGCQAVGCAIKM